MFDYSPINTYPCTPPGVATNIKKKHKAGVIHPGEGVHTWAGKIFVSLWKVKLDNEKHLGRRNDRPEFEERWDKEDSGSPGKEEQLFANESG